MAESWSIPDEGSVAAQMSSSPPWVRRSSRGASQLRSPLARAPPPVVQRDADDNWWDSAVAEDAVAEPEPAPAPAPAPERTIDPDSLAAALARPFPAGWPAPHLPFGRVESELSRLSADQLAQLQEAERRREEQPAEAKPKLKPKTPAPSKRSKLCRCGKHDTTKFMLGCDGCDRWFHGACVGVTEEAAEAAGGEQHSWYCKPCTRRREAEASRRRRYCICRGVWDGRAFMIACDACGVWYHGACVGFSPQTVHESTQAAFKKYCCPTCAAPSAAAAATPSRRAVAAAAKRNGKARALPPAPFAVGWRGEEAEAEAEAGVGVLHGEQPWQAWMRAAALGLRQRTPGPEAPGHSGLSGYPGHGHPGYTGHSGSTGYPGHTMEPPALFGFGGGSGGSASNRAAAPPPAAPGQAEGVHAARCGGGSADARPPHRSPPPPPPPPPRRDGPPLLAALSEDCVAHVLAQLPLPSLLLCAAPSCHRLALLAEPLFRAACEQQGWRPPRRDRDHPLKFRKLLRTRACTVCLAPAAHFPVRRVSSGVGCVFRLCKGCARRDKVQEQLRWHGLAVDAIGEHGKPLFARQFCTPLFGSTDGFAG